MTARIRPVPTPETEDVRIHYVSGIYIPCCETGETDCPCICHDNTNQQGES